MGFCGKDTVRSRLVRNGRISEQVSSFKYLCRNVSYIRDKYIDKNDK